MLFCYGLYISTIFVFLLSTSISLEAALPSLPGQEYQYKIAARDGIIGVSKEWLTVDPLADKPPPRPVIITTNEISSKSIRIVGIDISSALIPYLQPVASRARGKSVNQLNHELTSSIQTRDHLSDDDIWTLANYFAFMNDAQAVIDFGSISSTTPTATTPPESTMSSWCLSNSDLQDMIFPSNYCKCGEDHLTYFETTTGSNPCPYTAPPGPVITPMTWTAQSADLVTCSYPSTMSCATYGAAWNNPRGTAQETGISKRQKDSMQERGSLPLPTHSA
jgi:hypothetical protein